jgi:hypothetical protein
MTDDYEQIVAEYAAKRARLQLAQATPTPPVDRGEIARCAAMVQDCARAGTVDSYWRAMLYACRAMKAGLTHDASTDMLRSIGETQRLMCRWAGDAVIERPGARPREVVDVLEFWEAVEASYWDPDEDEEALRGAHRRARGAEAAPQVPARP